MPRTPAAATGPLTGAIVEKIARTPEELSPLVFHEWAKINEVGAAIERFNGEITL